MVLIHAAHQRRPSGSIEKLGVRKALRWHSQATIDCVDQFQHLRGCGHVHCILRLQELDAEGAVVSTKHRRHGSSHAHAWLHLMNWWVPVKRLKFQFIIADFLSCGIGRGPCSCGGSLRGSGRGFCSSSNFLCPISGTRRLYRWHSHT